MSQDLSPEVLRWNADKYGYREYYLDDPWLEVSFNAVDGTPVGHFQHRPESSRAALDGDHLMTFQFPCGHWFTRKPNLLRAIRRVLAEP